MFVTNWCELHQTYDQCEYDEAQDVEPEWSDDGFCEVCDRPTALADPGHPYGGHDALCEFNPNPISRLDDE